MKGDAEKLFEAFQFKVGDLVIFRSNREVRAVVDARFLPDGDKWDPKYRLNSIASNGVPVSLFASEIDIAKVP